MDILDFEGSATPVVMCEPNGRVIAKNPAACALTPTLRKGGKLSNITPPICRLPQGRCFAVIYEGAVWLLFCDFLQYDFDGAIFPTAREVLMMSGVGLLKTTAEHCALKKSKSQSHVARLRELLYSRFSFIFSSSSDPFRTHSTAALLKGLEAVLPSERIRFSAKAGPLRLVNTRNVSILLTTLSSMLLPHTVGRVKADACQAGDDLRLSLWAATDISFETAAGEALIDLYPYFAEYTADLFAADLCVSTCGYNASYELSSDGRISIDIYVKTETDLYTLLDPSAKVPFEKELALLTEKLR